MDSCNIRAAVQILQTSVRAPQNTQTAAEVHSLGAADTDEHEIARIKMQRAAVKQAATKFAPPQRSGWCEWPRELCWRPSQDPVVGAMLT